MRLRTAATFPGATYLLVTSDATSGADARVRPQSVGEALRPGWTEDRMSELYGDLHELLMRDLGHELVCRDGMPVRAQHDHELCVWCGGGADAHQVVGQISWRVRNAVPDLSRRARCPQWCFLPHSGRRMSIYVLVDAGAFSSSGGQGMAGSAAISWSSAVSSMSGCSANQVSIGWSR
jgi:hypothetical protein